MGVMSFLKGAGEKIFGKAHASDTDALNAKVKELGAENLQIDFNEGTVSVKGEAETQEQKEKVLLALGNVEGVEKVDESITVKLPAGMSDMYTVKKGDNLSKIAKHYYGKEDWKKIFEANKPLLSHPDKIYPGQVLRIPK